MTTRRRPDIDYSYGQDLDCDLPGPSPTANAEARNIVGGSPPGGRRRRRRAAPLAGAARYGSYTPVSMTVALRGQGQWLEVITPTGRFFTNPHVSVHALMQQVIGGGHWVLDEKRARHG